jgi:hypothetical protein
MATFKDKISQLINSQAPEFVVEQHPKFLEFVKTYYMFMESAELDVTSVQTTDGIQLETETAQNNELILDGSRIDSDRTQLDAGDKILLESSAFGKFTRGETITGQTSGATTTVLTEDLDNGRLFISAQDKFIIGETVLGASSNASAVINNYSPNPVTNIQELLNFRDPDKVISNFLTKFRNEFLNTLPENLNAGVNKRNLIKNVKSLYKAKGTNRGHELFFRLLFNEDSEIFYPREQMLRVSDGQWDTQKVLRAISTTGNTINLVGRTITGQTSGATAIVESVKKLILGNQIISEFIINDGSYDGTFSIGEEIRGTSSDTDDYFIKANITGIPGTKTTINDGNLNSYTDLISVNGGGTGARFSINDIGSGGITEIIVDDSGLDYSMGDNLVFNNIGTQGVNASGFVSVVNGGFTQESSTSITEDHIILEDETTSDDTYSGNKIVQEEGTGVGDITDVYITNSGSGYISLPLVSITSSSGVGAKLLTHGSEIGRIIGIKTNELGEGYENSPSPPTLSFYQNLILTTVTGNFSTNDTVTGSSSGATGTIVNYDSDRNLLKLKNVTGNFSIEETITSSSGGSSVLNKLDVANISVNIVSVGDTDGKFLNEDGFVSEQTMKIQDSLYYQDFSYVLKVGQSINSWRDSFKKTMHTAGFYFTGQVDLTSRLNLQIKRITGINSGITEILRNILTKLYSTIVGRRLGTETDGTTLRTNPELAVSADFDTSTITPFDKTTRDVTLKTQPINIDYVSRVRRNLSNSLGDLVNVRQGFAYAGPRLGTINRFANTAFGTTANTSATGGSSGITLQILNDIIVKHTKTTLDGSNAIFLMTSNEQGKKLKTNFTIPADIRSITLVYGQNSFDETLTTFDNDNITMDTQP